MSDWILRAGQSVEVIVSIDTDDPNRTEYHDLYNKAGFDVKIIENANRSAVDAVNAAAKVSTGDILVVVSDDFACPQLWALILEKHLKNSKNFLFKASDGNQKYIVTLPIMDRAYYNRFGYIYHPDYLHMFCDTELTHVADCLRKLIIRNDILFKHNHYSVIRKKRDDVSVRADATWEDGKRVYLKHCREKFGLGKDVDIMNLTAEGHQHKMWLKQNGIW